MSEDRNKWNVNEKPFALVCPRKFCFLWGEAENQCRRTFGLCIRENTNNSRTDWYEPCEPELRKAGLPWFYFIPNKDHLVEEQKEEYERETQKLWKHSD